MIEPAVHGEAPGLPQCPLCGAIHRTHHARFRQLYSQADGPPLPLEWWECRACAGWFVYPVPQPEAIKRNWEAVAYNDPQYEIPIAQGKAVVHRQILTGLSRRTQPGPLLDFGSNFGQFLLMAEGAGWVPYGFDPYRPAVEAARAKGFDVRCGWSLQDAGFLEGYFTAITAIDVFYYVWHPRAALDTYYRLLRPGGVLAMRLSNKRFFMGLARAFSPLGVKRDARMSRILQNQFHSISLASLTRVLTQIGFTDVTIEPRARTGWPWSSPWRTRFLYRLADALYVLTFRRVNLSPGVLLFARRKDES
jgi:SAM-dependent methyltransferase